MASPVILRHERAVASSVSFSRSRGQSEQADDDDDIQISLAPYVQNYLAQSGQKLDCCGACLPVPFERAAKQSWWDPRFDSEILEGQYRSSSFPQVRLRFQYALVYILAVSFSWFVYFIVTGATGRIQHWIPVSAVFAVLLIIIGLILAVTYRRFYRTYAFPISIFVAVIICILLLVFIILNSSNSKASSITPVGQFSLCIETLLIIYTVIQLPLYVCVAIGSIFSILFECLIATLYFKEDYGVNTNTGVVVRTLLHIVVHLIGIHVLIMTNARMRGTFMKVGQSLLVRRQLEMEKQLKEKMIHSVMPPKVADWLMSETGGAQEDEYEDSESLQKPTHGKNHASGGNDIRSLFRPFNMNRMENVSILFADIVGFTRMSSNKSAEELVGILNDLFERFDDLSAKHGCEKISTLGDCYYCVAGCPEPKLDHAKACIEMGLDMIVTIKQFDAETNEDVNMRVGVHTGTVLCGIVGTRRFKFDVWSNDVTFANQMESTGKPGQVHISEVTARFLNNEYVLEEGDTVQGTKTYFVVGRKCEFRKPHSPTAVTGGTHLEISPSLQPRIRVQSCVQSSAIRPHYLHLMTDVGVRQAKACSLPSILDSDNEDEGCDVRQLTKSPVSLAGTSFSPKYKPWRYHRKLVVNSEETEPLGLQGVSRSSPPMIRAPAAENKENGVHQGVEPHAETEQLRPVSTLGVPVSSSDQLSMCASVNSRKDSGIRSNSRRSSIQQQIFVMNGIVHGDLLTHRVSGYYTSSQSSVNEADGDPDRRPVQLPPPLSDNLGMCFQSLRKQSDLQLIKCVQDSATSQRSYFVKPPLRGFSLFFRQKEMEKEYRANAHRVTDKTADSPPTLATSRYNTYFDILISALVYLAVTVSLFLLYRPTVAWISVCVGATTVQLIAVFLCISQLVAARHVSLIGKRISKRLLKIFSSWYPWHFIGAVLVSLPVISVLVNFVCLNFEEASNADFYYSYLLFVSLVHFCNFTQLNCWMKSCLATLAGVCYIALIASHTCPFFINIPSNFSTWLRSVNASNESIYNWNGQIKLAVRNSIHNGIAASELSTKEVNISRKSEAFLYEHVYHINNLYHGEIFLDVLMLLILVWFLNREFEISYRLSFHGNVVAARDKARVQNMKNQADLLLHNIIPKHVADQLKNTAKYSENHHDVGIIFASIVNFNEMYDESYLGGKEYLRVLNELIGDFDELLTKPEFRNVEKIKTIGSTFMAASGLNPGVRRQSQHPNQHLFELMEFAIAMQKVIDDFNRNLLEFNLVLRVGYNFGDVTAGVIGTKKLYYDIWGDAVNIASRMDSTGIRGRIQVGGACLPILSERYEFEPRGSVYVKGKDHMEVFLLKGRCGEVSAVSG
ncbi:adenylate cyclase type 9 [Schistocerca piceifrons]|uniref:adenylate cyclase type 9 n=1 Tax=Schistocerca piceifrons TaxID=274613 RepID=UPI001F5EA781|nr:adenylate cyclase type 9 [Schistocerca piceifrons]